MGDGLIDAMSGTIFYNATYGQLCGLCYLIDYSTGGTGYIPSNGEPVRQIIHPFGFPHLVKEMDCEVDMEQYLMPLCNACRVYINTTLEEMQERLKTEMEESANNKTDQVDTKQKPIRIDPDGNVNQQGMVSVYNFHTDFKLDDFQETVSYPTSKRMERLFIEKQSVNLDDSLIVPYEQGGTVHITHAEIFDC